MNNELSESEPLILKFIQTLEKQIPDIPIDESMNVLRLRWPFRR